MTSHELARKFLSLPDRPVLVEGEGCYYKLPTSVAEATLEDGTEVIFVEADDDDRALCDDEVDEE